MKAISSAKPISRRHVTTALCYAATAVALLAVSSWISVPVLAVPFTLQTFALFFIVGLLGTKWSLVAVAAYILLGVAGVPVFSGFGGGVTRLLGVTGGYIVGFVFVCLVSGPLLKLAKNNAIWQFAAMLAGLVVCYAFGTAWFCVVSGNGSASGVASALLSCVVPFVAVDVAKILLAIFALRKLRPLLPTLPFRAE